MRFASSLVAAALAAAGVSAGDAQPIHRTRYAMGTMYDIVVYHESEERAQQAVTLAFDEIVRLDRVMSNFKDDSELSRLNREGAHGFVQVDSSLYDVVSRSLELSRASGGRFDVTIAPVLRLWKQAHEDGRRPSDAEIAAARACVGGDKVETRAPDRIRYRQPCVEIDLGGVGKGYAVERALAVLANAGIERALVNAGASSIGAMGAPPGRDGWPVRVGSEAGGQTLLLRDESTSTSEQRMALHAFTGAPFGHIIDPRIGAPAREEQAVTVRARSATVAEALSKALLLSSKDEARALLARFSGVSAVWISPSGHVEDVR